MLLNLLVDIDGKERVLLSLEGLAVSAVTVVALVAGGAFGGSTYVLGEVHHLCVALSIFKK